jgi:hypothetical protein
MFCIRTVELALIAEAPPMIPTDTRAAMMTYSIAVVPGRLRRNSIDPRDKPDLPFRNP